MKTKRKPVDTLVAIYGATSLPNLPDHKLHLRADLAWFSGEFHLCVSSMVFDRDGNHRPLFPTVRTHASMPVERYGHDVPYNRHRHAKLVDDHRADRTVTESLMRLWCEREGVTLLAREPQPFDDDFVPDADDVDDADGKGGAA